jgi:dTDP-4-dehydrorhamnose reductase
MTQSGQVNGYTNAIWGGVTTLELAKAIDYVLSNDSVTGLVHLSNGEQISKYKLLQLIKNVWNKQNVEIRKGLSDKTINKSISKSEILKYPVPAYTQMINEQFTWMVKHKDIYKIYTY